MDFHLKQWSNQQHESEQQQPQRPPAKLPRLLFDPQQQQQQQQLPSASSALPLFASEPTCKQQQQQQQLSILSAYPPDNSTPTSTKFPRIESYFSLAQWQELELQAVIFRHMLAGATVPPELLHLVKKSLPNSTTHYLPHPVQHYSHYHPACYWGRVAMDPEPGRCRRTDGKKWRCSRDVVAGHKYCERHMHRGRNRSRKPVETPTPAAPAGGVASAAAAAAAAAGGTDILLKASSNPISYQPLISMDGGSSYFGLSASSPSIDLFHLDQRSIDSKDENKSLLGHQNEISEDGKSAGRVLRHFFDDWPRVDNAGSNGSSVNSAPSLSVSMPGSSSSDFSLKLSTGTNGDELSTQEMNAVERERPQISWAAAWGANQVVPMGGPLAEALRSSTNSSPTSVLRQITRASTSEASYVST